jgi:hypothetical protein
MISNGSFVITNDGVELDVAVLRDKELFISLYKDKGFADPQDMEIILTVAQAKILYQYLKETYEKN